MSTVVDGIMAQDSMQARIGGKEAKIGAARNQKKKKIKIKQKSVDKAASSVEKIDNGSGGQNVTVDMAEGSGEYRPIVGSSACQTENVNGHIRVISSEPCSHDKMNNYAKNPPNMESTSDKAVDRWDNDEASDEDAISVNFAASWERENDVNEID
ncbi:hypothetical protein SCA6_001997 [Theobroma cacao]